MAFATHMLLRKEADSATAATYLVVSLDFNPEGEWQPIGKLTIQKSQKSFAFEPLNEWAAKGITVSMDDPGTAEEFNAAGEYWMAWRGRIRTWAVRMIEQDRFPESYPG
ncbi:MAG: hypothetical protein KKC79_04765 [Gammaproteobacteria bacterium]|nr:hypothetical protein [Gammaproteobacteria bacterium]MBU1440345.1 hypothetical protein [Gammaproteobacteria bacterium]MBU2287216.1 hypothetical protein [Gammaproteobacteria bacterium]MBU2407946.1 hypothetical protein [Gammaproteobacteria bacterium]